MYFDYTIIILIPAMILAFYAQHKVNSAYNTYSRVGVRNGTTGREAARQILDSSGLQNVNIEVVSGKMTDHYDPRKRVMRLSPEVYNGSTIAAVSIAAHEAGHAIQHGHGYAPLTIRNVIAPVASVMSKAAFPLLIIGLIIWNTGSYYYYWGPFLFDLGILFYGAAVVFQVITLPVEFNASKRAVNLITDMGLVYEDEVRGAKKMLSAAALTYVAAMAAAIAQLLRLLLIRGRN